ncbi:MAG: hypothetical protein NC127_06395 [Muribaculum sp.]|nr:hypothetical protein [Muribaculum sp.]
MGKINTSDIIFATITQRGKRIGTFRLSGLESFAEIIRTVRRLSAGAIGLVTVTLRNGTQGWRHTRSIMLNPAPERPVQLCFAF